MSSHDAQRDGGFRAIGRYIVAFSELVHEMRQHSAQHIGGEHWVRADIALGELPAMNVANAFFGLCRDSAEFNDAEEKVASALYKAVQESIHDRNDIAHGDWTVGALRMREAESGFAMEMMPPRLVRILPHRKAGPYRAQELTVQDIDGMSDRLLDLVALVVEFGKLALDFALFTLDGRVVAGVEYRVADVLVVRGGKGNEPTRVERKGPRAGELHPTRYL